MRVYTRAQLSVVFCILAVTVPYAIARWYRAHAAQSITAAPAPSAVYEIRGDVIKEGFYYFSAEQRASDLLQAAGGLKWGKDMPDSRADSAIIKSGKKIFFKTDTAYDCCWEISEMDAAAHLTFFMPVAINTASAEELMLIPGIGSKTAEAVVAYRKTHKRINDLRELGSLPGMGEKKLQALLPYISTGQ